MVFKMGERPGRSLLGLFVNDGIFRGRKAGMDMNIITGGLGKQTHMASNPVVQ